MGPVSLRVDLSSENDTAYAHYSNFTIESEAKFYAIEVSGYTGTAGTFRGEQIGKWTGEEQRFSTVHVYVLHVR